MPETLTEDFTLGYTGAFWDYRTLPIPCGINPFRIHAKVLKALEKKGLIGYLALWFFDDQPLMPEFKEAQFFFPRGVPKNESERAKRMIKEILLFALVNSLRPDGYGNLMVVSNTISQEPELVSVLKALELRNHNVLLVQSDRAKKADFPTLSLDWLFLTMLNDDMDGDDGDRVGDEAIAKRKKAFAERKRAIRERRIALAKTKNALARKKNALARGKVVKATTGVFWDVSDCPLPEGYSVRSLYFSIKYSFEENKVHDSGDMSVFTYGDSHNTLPSEYSVETPFSLGGNIVHAHAHAGDKESRVYKMMWDILLWAFDNHQTGLNLVVILSSEDKEFVNTFAYTEFVDTLLELKAKGYNVLLVQPEMESSPEYLLGYASSIWLWTSLLHHFNSAKDVEVLGMERLKIELQSRGLKCGGTLQELAERLFLLKSTPLDKLPKKLFAKIEEKEELNASICKTSQAKITMKPKEEEKLLQGGVFVYQSIILN